MNESFLVAELIDGGLHIIHTQLNFQEALEIVDQLTEDYPHRQFFYLPE